MGKGVWRMTVRGVTEADTTEHEHMLLLGTLELSLWFSHFCIQCSAHSRCSVIVFWMKLMCFCHFKGMGAHKDLGTGKREMKAGLEKAVVPLEILGPQIQSESITSLSNRSNSKWIQGACVSGPMETGSFRSRLASPVSAHAPDSFGSSLNPPTGSHVDLCWVPLEGWCSRAWTVELGLWVLDPNNFFFSPSNLRLFGYSTSWDQWGLR